MRLKDSPLLSIIVPIYNVEPYLKRFLDSVISQDYKNKEVILINDGSTDNSLALCQSYADRYPNIYLYSQENKGLSVARNVGFTKAKGTIISFLDSDDWILPGMFSTMIGKMLTHNLDVIECGIVRSSDLNERKTIDYNESEDLILENNKEALHRIISNQCFSVWRRLYKKETIKNLSFIPDKIHQDVFYTLDLFNEVERYGYLPHRFYIYNNENASIIRSPYNEGKFNAIDAAYYVLNYAQNRDPELQYAAEGHTIEALTYHYNSLFLYPSYDPDHEVRKSIKSTISHYYSSDRDNIYAFLIKHLHQRVYEYFIRINELRLKLKFMFLNFKN